MNGFRVPQKRLKPVQIAGHLIGTVQENRLKMKLLKKLNIRRDNGGHMRRYGLFECPMCGCEIEKLFRDGKKNKTCGCDRHGMCGSRLYGVWTGIRSRCSNKNRPSYKNYGGRGISVCDEWFNFNHFYDWAISNGYKVGLDIDRTNNDGNYEPSNCRFVTRTVNMRNSRQAKLTMKEANEIRLIYKKSSLTQTEIGKLYGVTFGTISHIVNNRTWR